MKKIISLSSVYCLDFRRQYFSWKAQVRNNSCSYLVKCETLMLLLKKTIKAPSLQGRLASAAGDVSASFKKAHPWLDHHHPTRHWCGLPWKRLMRHILGCFCYGGRCDHQIPQWPMTEHALAPMDAASAPWQLVIKWRGTECREPAQDGTSWPAQKQQYPDKWSNWPAKSAMDHTSSTFIFIYYTRQYHETVDQRYISYIIIWVQIYTYYIIINNFIDPTV